ncbi:MAG: hypothetical protein ABSC25_08685 [Roseiarcus sp.]
MVETLSEATGAALATVVDIDRRLVKAGLRTKGGRGLSAARMTALDAARLLTAIIGSPQATASGEAVRRYAETHVDRRRSSEGLFGGIEVDDLARLPARHSFVDGLTALIASAANGALAAMAAASGSHWQPHIEVYAFTRATYGRIRLSGMPNGNTASVEYIMPRTADGRVARNASGRKKGAPIGEGQGDLEQSRRVTERTILAVAELLREET